MMSANKFRFPGAAAFLIPTIAISIAQFASAGELPTDRVNDDQWHTTRECDFIGEGPAAVSDKIFLDANQTEATYRVRHVIRSSFIPDGVRSDSYGEEFRVRSETESLTTYSLEEMRFEIGNDQPVPDLFRATFFAETDARGRNYLCSEIL